MLYFKPNGCARLLVVMLCAATCHVPFVAQTMDVEADDQVPKIDTHNHFRLGAGACGGFTSPVSDHVSFPVTGSDVGGTYTGEQRLPRSLELFAQYRFVSGEMLRLAYVYDTYGTIGNVHSGLNDPYAGITYGHFASYGISLWYERELATVNSFTLYAGLGGGVVVPSTETDDWVWTPSDDDEVYVGGDVFYRFTKRVAPTAGVELSMRYDITDVFGMELRSSYTYNFGFAMSSTVVLFKDDGVTKQQIAEHQWVRNLNTFRLGLFVSGRLW